ncbi:MAG TPA: biopolymer transporter ExbD [Pseudomonadales bacterium]
MSSFRLKHRRAAAKRENSVVTLNLVSLTDFFTILLVFLLANSTETEVLTMNSAIKLPESTSVQRPEERMVISVSNDFVVVNGRRVAQFDETTEHQPGLIFGLEEELRDEALRRGSEPKEGYDVTIMGDRDIPYWLLKKIMMTCQATDFANVSLAVNRIKAGTPDAGDAGIADATVSNGAVLAPGGAS